jgi:uncharacterized protein (TIGR00159 family)
MIEFITSIGISGILDIIFMTLIIYSLLIWFKRTRAGFAVIGLFMFGISYGIARQLDLLLTTTVFQGFFAIILIAVVIIFQEEIKQFLEQLASWSFFRDKRSRRLLSMWHRRVGIFVNTANTLAKEHTGALIVIRGKNPIVRHLNGGTDMNGEISEALLETIFTPGVPTHDGAVIVDGNELTKFSSYLPLSKNLRKLQKAGTRHAAALGLAERTDAFCIVVSEERGTISVARNGDIQIMRDIEELQHRLEAFYQEITPAADSKPWKEIFRRNYKEIVIAFLSTVVLWFFFVHESGTDYKTYVIPLRFDNLPQELSVKKMEPEEVEVTFSGPRRSFIFLNEKKLEAHVIFFNAHEGIVHKTLARSSIIFPEGLYVENIQPSQVAIQLEEKK